MKNLLVDQESGPMNFEISELLTSAFCKGDIRQHNTATHCRLTVTNFSVRRKQKHK